MLKQIHAWLNLWDKHMTTGRINQVYINLENTFKLVLILIHQIINTWILSRTQSQNHENHTVIQLYVDENCKVSNYLRLRLLIISLLILNMSTYSNPKLLTYNLISGSIQRLRVLRKQTQIHISIEINWNT